MGLAEPAPSTLRALRRAAGRGARIASVCTGAFALAYAGLLDGCTATTHWQEAAALAARFPAVRVDPDVLYVDAGSVLTSAGVAAGIDLCLHMVRADHGAEAASEIARGMVIAPHRGGGQAQFLQRPIPQSGPGLAATCAWALDRLDEPLSVDDMARQAGVAPRTLARHFNEQLGASPLGWLGAHRVLHARRLLEQTDLPIEVVARRCGLGTATNLRKRFARDTATTPSAYRASFRGAGSSTEQR